MNFISDMTTMHLNNPFEYLMFDKFSGKFEKVKYEKVIRLGPFGGNSIKEE